MTAMLTSIHGRRFGLGAFGQLVANEVQITQPAVDATITIGVAGAGHAPRTVTVQLLDCNGAAINYIQEVDFDVMLDALGAAWAVTGGSTGLAVGANGAVLAQVSKLAFRAKTDATGKWVGTWTDTAGETAFLAVTLPSGRTIMSAGLATVA